MVHGRVFQIATNFFKISLAIRCRRVVSIPQRPSESRHGDPSAAKLDRRAGLRMIESQPTGG
jgi:hypothetical protein